MLRSLPAFRPALFPALLLCTTNAFAQVATERISLSSSGSQANRRCGSGAITPDGRFVLFSSPSDNLVPGDTNLANDIFLRDRQLGTTERVSVGSGGVQGNADAYDSDISADGRFVCFSSFATNLVAGDTNGSLDVFVLDRQTSTTERVSVSSSGAQAATGGYAGSISGDGRFVTFRSNAALVVPTTFYRILRRDRQTGQTTLADVLPAGYTRMGSSQPEASLSADGRYVAFQAKVQVVSPPGIHDQVFVFDAQSGTTVQVSLGSSGALANTDSLWPMISSDGGYVAFMSWATNLVTGFTPDSGGALFLRNLAAGTTELIGTSSTGIPAHLSNLSPSGVSAGGRFIVFNGIADNLVYGDTGGYWDVFLKDRLTGATRRVDVAPGGAQALTDTWGGFLTPDGRFLALTSASSNLVAGDTNGVSDAFVVDTQPATPQVYCSALQNSQGCLPAIAGSGTASFTSALPFTVSATSLINRQPTLLAYSVAPSSRPFGGGILCIERPLTLLAPVSSGGNPSGIDCSGSFAQDFNARIQSGLDPRLVPGTVVFAQVHSGDPLAPSGQGRAFSDALAFTIAP